MKILTFLAAVGVAIGNPIISNVVSIGAIGAMDKPITAITYEELLPVVKETVSTIIHSTIPAGCTHLAVPYMAVGLVRVHMVHIVRDVLMMLEGRTVGDALILDTIRNPIAIPTAALAPRVNEILHRIRTIIPMYRELPITRLDITKVTPTQVKALELFNVILTIFDEHITELMSTLNIIGPIPLEKLLITMTTSPIDVEIYNGVDVPTVRKWLAVVIRKIEMMVDIDTSICRTPAIPISRIIAIIETFRTKIEMIRIEDIVGRLPTNIFGDISLVKEIVVKVIPVIKDTTPVINVINIMKISPETGFMNFIINFASECLVTATISNMNAYTVVTSIIKPEIIVPIVDQIAPYSEMKPIIVKILTKVMARAGVILNSKGVPLFEIVDTVVRTLGVSMIGTPGAISGPWAIGTPGAIPGAIAGAIPGAIAGPIGGPWGIATESEMRATIGEVIKEIFKKVLVEL